jgi:hypothetical protein
MMMTIKDIIEHYKTELGESIKKVEELRENKIKKMMPKNIRANYDSFYDRAITQKISEIEASIQNTETEIKGLKECIELLNKLKSEFDKTASVINKKRVGTLEGKTRDRVESHPPKEITEIAKVIVDQPYDELEAINRLNGGKKYNKRNTKANKRNTKSNKRNTKSNN